jgi:stalled ribosome alternative rescue factor ArfA
MKTFKIKLQPKRRNAIAKVLKENTLFRQRVIRSKKAYDRKRLKRERIDDE